MKWNPQELVNWLKQSLSSSNIASFGRTACAIIIYFMIVWECYIISKTVTWVDIPSNWLYLVVSLYGVSKTGETVQAIVPTTGSKSTSSVKTEITELTTGADPAKAAS
jgi:hypothetical protein